MNKWLKQCELELRLILGNPVFALFPVIYGILFLMFALGMGEYSEPRIYRRLYEYHAIAHTISLGPAMLLGILAVRRDIRRSSYEWNRSLPVSFGMLLSSKYVVGILYMSLFTLSTSIIFYVVSVGYGVEGSIVLRHTMNIAAQAEVSYLVTFALAMLLAVCIPNRVVYLIGFCAWMFGTFFMDIFLIQASGLYPLKTFHLSQFFLNSSLLGDETWGSELFKEEQGISRLFVLAFTLLMFMVSLLLLNRTRPTMSIKMCWLTTVGAAVLAVAAFIPYGSLWQEHYASIREKLNDPTILVSETEFSRESKFLISKYDITLKRDENDLLHFKTKLEIPAEQWNGRSSFPLTLHRNFQVSKVLVQGVDTSYRRAGDHLNVEIPNEARGNLQVELVYSGKMMDFLKSYSGEKYTAFSVRTEVNLPRYMAWYPLPGYQHVYVKNSYTPDQIFPGYRFTGMYFPPAEVKLTIEGYENPLYSGIPELERKKGYQRFEGKEMTGFSLMGSRDWIELKHEGLPVTLVTTPYNREYMEKLMIDLKEKYDYFTEWMPELKSEVRNILYIGTLVDSLEDARGYVEGELIFSSESYSDDFTGIGLSGEWMNAMLFGNQKGMSIYTADKDVEKDVRSRISSLFWYLYYRETQGLSDKEILDQYGWARSIQILTMKDLDYDPKGIGIQMRKQVLNALAKGKEQQVKKLLLHFYNEGLSLHGKEDSAYLKERPISYKEWQQEWNKFVGSSQAGQ